MTNIVRNSNFRYCHLEFDISVTTRWYKFAVAIGKC